MNDARKTKKELLKELEKMRQRVTELERKDDAHLYNILHAIDDYIFILDQDNRFLSVYSPAGELYLPPDEFLGKTHAEVMPAHVDDLFTAAVSRIKQGEIVDYEYQLEMLDGLRWYAMKLSPLMDGERYTGLVAVARDITEQVQTKQELSEQKEYFERIIDTSNAIIIGLDKNHRIKLFNKGAEKITSYEAQEALGRDWFELFFAQEILAEMDKVWESSWGIAFHSYSNPIMIKNGDERIISWQTTGIYEGADEENHIMLSIGEDITVRVQAEQALRESEFLLNATQQLTKVGGWKWNVENETMFWTDETYRIHEIDPTKIEAGSTEHVERGVKCYDEKDRQTILEAFQKCVDEGISYDMEFPFTTVKGKRIWIRTTAQAEKEKGKVVCVIGNIMDITERKEAEDKLHERETKFRLLADYTFDWEYWIDPEGNYIYISPSCERLTGYNAEEFRARPELLFDIVHPEYAKKIHAHYHDENNWDHPVTTLEFPIINQDGQTVWLAHHCSPIFDEQGQYLGRRGNNRDITARIQARTVIEKHLRQLAALHEIDQAITGNLDLKMTLDILLGHLLTQLEVDAAIVLRYEKDSQTLIFSQGKGFLTTALQHTNLRLGQGYAGEVALQDNEVFIPDLNQSEKSFLTSPRIKEEEGFVAYYGLPLIVKGELVGVLEIFHRSALNLESGWVDYLKTLAGQAAIAIDNINLFNDLEYSNLNLLQAYDATIEGWAQALELRDFETVGHSRRVVKITLELAQRLGISGEELTQIRRGALLHDIGKMGVPDAILQKPGKLSEAEWQIMHQHPIYAYKWLSPIEYLRPALDIPYYHHERWDGTGYPHGLKGKQIPLSARIFAIVDIWDALRSDRPYRKAWSKEKTLTHIQAESGKHFDPQVMDAFLEYIRSQ
jgi:PAS domain S-box-containing protein